jgi:hypothetical protein
VPETPLGPLAGPVVPPSAGSSPTSPAPGALLTPTGGTGSYSTTNNRLVPVGQLSGLGAGQKIYSVRFVGDTAYVVTFRQVVAFPAAPPAPPSGVSRPHAASAARRQAAR